MAENAWDSHKREVMISEIDKLLDFLHLVGPENLDLLVLVLMQL